MSYLFHEILSHINNLNASGKTAYTIAEGETFPFWAGILIFSISYIFVTMILYFLIEAHSQRKK